MLETDADAKAMLKEYNNLPMPNQNLSRRGDPAIPQVLPLGRRAAGRLPVLRRSRPLTPGCAILASADRYRPPRRVRSERRPRSMPCAARASAVRGTAAGSGTTMTPKRRE